MNKKLYIALIAVLLILIITIVVMKVNIPEEDDETDIINTEIRQLREDDSEIYDLPIACIQEYNNYVAEENAEAVLDILEDNYKLENNIVETNVLSKVVNLPEEYDTGKCYISTPNAWLEVYYLYSEEQSVILKYSYLDDTFWIKPCGKVGVEELLTYKGDDQDIPLKTYNQHMYNY